MREHVVDTACSLFRYQEYTEQFGGLLCNREDRIMFENLNTITLQGEKYPIRCDINVCEMLQDEFGSLAEFERRLLGLEFQRDAKGQIRTTVRPEDGRAVPDFKLTEPSIKAIRIAIKTMTQEGKLFALEQGDPVPDIDVDKAILNMQFDRGNVAKQLHEEYARCLEQKNVKTSKSV